MFRYSGRADTWGMSTTPWFVTAYERMSSLLEEAGLPAPDDVECGEDCIRLLWHERKVCICIDREEVPGVDYQSLTAE